MWKSYITIVFRRLSKNKLFSAVNILGLTAGLTVCLLIVCYISYQTGFDRFHERVDRIYRLSVELVSKERMVPSLPPSVHQQIKEEYPEVVQTAATQNAPELLVEANGKLFYESEVSYATETLFEMFSFKILSGDPVSALKNPGNIVITRQAALKYFNDPQPLGEILLVSDEQKSNKGEGESVTINTSERQPYRISAVVEAPPAQSSIQFDFLLPLQTAASGGRWWQFNTTTYLLLQSEGHVKELTQKLPDFVKTHSGARDQTYRLHLQPLSEVHLDPYMNMSKQLSPLQYIYIFSVAAFLILLISGFNFASLNTAQASQRAREVGVRKVAGAQRHQLIAQYLSEAVIKVLLSAGLSLFLLWLILPFFNRFLGLDLAFSLLFRPDMLALFTVLLLLVGLLSGSYTAFVMTKFNPAHVIKGLVTYDASRTGFRKFLIAFQLVISVVFILGTIILGQQMEYIRSSRLNVSGSQVVMISDRSEVLESLYDPFKKALLNEPAIASVTSGQKPGDISFKIYQEYKDSTGTYDYLSLMLVGDDYLRTLDLELKKGTNFRKVPIINPDSTRVYIVNETAARVENLYDKVGQRVELNGGGFLAGIVEDYHIESMYEPITPLIMQYRSGAKSTILVKLRENHIQEGLKQIRSVWDRFVDSHPLNYSFLDDELDQVYRSELQLSNMFSGFSILAVILACMGLFAQAAFTVNRQKKNIAIRKVFGASISRLLIMLSKEFIWLMLLGFLIASPIAWYASNTWLQNFAYRISVDSSHFFVTGLIITLVTLLTISWHTLRASTQNPVENLRQE